LVHYAFPSEFLEEHAEETISPGGFYQRLTPPLAEYLRDLVETALDEVTDPEAIDADIDRFRA
jgi:putative transposase